MLYEIYITQDTLKRKLKLMKWCMLQNDDKQV